MTFKTQNKKTTVDVFVITYNEEFILPHFISHYQNHFGASITVFDNKSTDRTVEIAKQAGCIVKSYDTSNQIRDDVYLSVKNNCWKNSKADWVIVCDADEFLEAPFNVGMLTLLNVKGYDIIGGVNSRLGTANKMFNKTVMFKPGVIREINYRPGCHACSPAGEVISGAAHAKLLHRKYISEEYVFKKHLEYKARLSQFNKQYALGIEYEQASEEWVKQKFKELHLKAELI